MTNSVDPDQTAPRSSLFAQELSVSILAGIMIPYFFDYKTRVFFFFQNNPKDLDPSC